MTGLLPGVTKIPLQLAARFTTCCTVNCELCTWVICLYTQHCYEMIMGICYECCLTYSLIVHLLQMHLSPSCTGFRCVPIYWAYQLVRVVGWVVVVGSLQMWIAFLGSGVLRNLGCLIFLHHHLVVGCLASPLALVVVGCLLFPSVPPTPNNLVIYPSGPTLLSISSHIIHAC